MARCPKKRIIDVTQTDIDDGVPNDPERCSVQLASWRAFPDADKVKVLSGALHVSFSNETWMYRLPRTANCIPVLVDLGMKEEVKPLKFIVDRPVVSRRNHRAKPVTVKEHQRALPGEGDEVAADKTPRQKRQQDNSARTAAKHMREVISKLGYGSRYAGNEV